MSSLPDSQPVPAVNAATDATGTASPHPDAHSGAHSNIHADDIAHPRAIRSFVIRAGRLTTGQAKAIADFGPRFVCPYAPSVNPSAGVDASQGFIARLLAEAQAQGQRYERVVMEIGFGMGAATAHIAALQPNTLFVCCEVHEPGVGALLKLVGEQGLQNIRIVQHDAVQVLQHMVGVGALDGVHIFFPDPWHKKRHNKRRLIQPPFVETLVQHLKPGGYIHLATDWEPYAEQMLEVLRANPRLRNRASDASGWADKPDYRPLTKFEARGIRLGHGVWDLVFERQA